MSISNKGLIRITILAKTQSIEAEVHKRQRSKKSRQKQNRDLEEIKDEPVKSQKLKELEKQISKVEKLQKIKVEEKRVSTEFDVSLINAEDVERFYNFLQLDHEDDKYTMDNKINNKDGYPKSIIFEGLEGSYAQNYSQRDISSSYSKQKDETDKYSVIHGKDDVNEESKFEPNEGDSKLESSDTNQIEPKDDSVKDDKYSNIVVDVQPDSGSVGKEENQSNQDESEKPQEAEVSEAKPSEEQQPLAEITQEELNNQPATTENIIDPEGKKEEWKVDE